MRYRLAALLLLAALPAHAQPSVPVRLSYAAYIHGLTVMAMQASLDVTATTYKLQINYRLTGVVGAMVSGDSTTTVDGRFTGTTPLPRQFFSTGHFRGQARVTQLDWRDGTPVTTQLAPPVEDERDPVPVADQAHSIDTMSAMASLLRQVATTGQCAGSAKTFDGRRLSVISARTVGQEMLEETSRSSFHGPALRCDFEGRQTGGFVHDADPETLRRPTRGSAWFARLTPDGPIVPVRITFGTRQFGDATMYLTQE